MNYELPSYRNHGGQRAYLTVSADIYGHWTAGYHLWNGEDAAIEPVVNDAPTIEDALKYLAEAMKV